MFIVSKTIVENFPAYIKKYLIQISNLLNDFLRSHLFLIVFFLLKNYVFGAFRIIFVVHNWYKRKNRSSFLSEKIIYREYIHNFIKPILSLLCSEFFRILVTNLIFKIIKNKRWRCYIYKLYYCANRGLFN